MSLKPDTWEFLKTLTHARIALGRAGDAVTTKELLNFRLAHSKARDSVWREVDFTKLKNNLASQQTTVEVQSQCTGKQHYLLNPELGRILSLESKSSLAESIKTAAPADCVLVIADGLSAEAVHSNAAMFANEFSKAIQEVGLTLGPLILARYARVALGDDIAQIAKTRSVLMLIGERPGLASSESLSAYFTYAPQVNSTDANRNCISNIHAQGLPPVAAARMASHLIYESMRRRLSGVDLKIEYPDLCSAINL